MLARQVVSGDAPIAGSFLPGVDRYKVNVTNEDRERFVGDVLAALPGPGAEPVSTNQLGDRFGLGPYERSALLWSTLDKLARAGLVERVVIAGAPCRYWRRTGPRPDTVAVARAVR